MKKIFIVFMLLLIFAPYSYAQNRGALPNVFASWYSVTKNSSTRIVFPGNTRDLTIQNGDATTEIFVDLKGGVIPGNAINSGTNTPHIFKLDTASAVTLSDYITDSITIAAQGATTSPVTVIATY